MMMRRLEWGWLPVGVNVMKKKLDNKTNSPTLSHFTFRVQISTSVFKNLQTVPCHSTTSGLHSQANPSLHTLASHVCLRQIQACTFTRQDCCPLHTRARSTLWSDPEWCRHNVISLQCSECQCGSLIPSAGKRQK